MQNEFHGEGFTSAGIETAKSSTGVVIGDVPSQPTRRSGERSELHQPGMGRSPGHKRLFSTF